MFAILATGTLPFPRRPGTTDFTPLVTVLVALLVVRLVLGIRLRWPVLAIVGVVGTVLGWAIEAWGIAVPAVVAFVSALIVTTPLHRRARGGGAPA